MRTKEITYQVGLPERFRSDADSLFGEVFGCDFPSKVPCDKNLPPILDRCFMHKYTIVALSEGQLIGIVRFKVPNGLLTERTTYTELLSILGFIKGNLVALLYCLYERNQILQTIMIGGIAVRPNIQGEGVGSRLLAEVTNYAKKNGYKYVRLDVMDFNSKAKNLYERNGFKTVKSRYIEYFRGKLGLAGATTMELCLQTKA